MENIKKLTGKDPSEYIPVAKMLIDNADAKLYEKLVEQDDFLFPFVKENVANRIKQACNKDNYLNLLKFFGTYSSSYDTAFAEVLYEFGGNEIFDKIQELYLRGNLQEQAYSLKYFLYADENKVKNLISEIRNSSESDYEPVSVNAIEVLSKINDEESKVNALEKLNSDDEFEQYGAVKFLAIYGAKDCVQNIISVMKKSGFAENIASEIPYLMPLNELLESDYESGILVLCYIINAIPDIIMPSAVIDYNLAEILENLMSKELDSSLAVLLRLARDKFEEFTLNDEYLFDSDKKTKDEFKKIYELLRKLNIAKLNSLLYDELYDESDFVFFAIDYADEIEELETLIESKNPTLILKVLSKLKEKGMLNQEHKAKALENIDLPDLRNVVLAI